MAKGKKLDRKIQREAVKVAGKIKEIMIVIMMMFSVVQDSPCSHHGQCEPLLDSFECSCHKPWTGERCQERWWSSWRSAWKVLITLVTCIFVDRPQRTQPRHRQPSRPPATSSLLSLRFEQTWQVILFIANLVSWLDGQLPGIHGVSKKLLTECCWSLKIITSR